MCSLPPIPLKHIRGKHPNPQHSQHHPRQQHPKVASQMALCREDNRPSTLDGVIKRERVPVLVESGHDFERGEGTRDIEDDPEGEEVARPFGAD